MIGTLWRGGVRVHILKSRGFVGSGAKRVCVIDELVTRGFGGEIAERQNHTDECCHKVYFAINLDPSHQKPPPL